MIQVRFDDAELERKSICAGEIRKQLDVQKKRYPLMTEQDVVKFVFQGMLGVGHLISSLNDAQQRLAAEMDPLEPDEHEPLFETISTDWVRLNLRPAKAQGISPKQVAQQLCLSAELVPSLFSRQDVYSFCVGLDGSAEMKAAAENILDAGYLPSHSARYREAYHPAYRVMHQDFMEYMA